MNLFQLLNVCVVKLDEMQDSCGEQVVAAVACFKILSRNLPENTEKNNETITKVKCCRYTYLWSLL
jgi:hypothetical protein